MTAFGRWKKKDLKSEVLIPMKYGENEYRPVFAHIDGVWEIRHVFNRCGDDVADDINEATYEFLWDEFGERRENAWEHAFALRDRNQEAR